MAQTEHTFESKSERPVQLRYLLYLPKGYGSASGRKWPLILFLHGMGERGEDLLLVKKTGLAQSLDSRDLDFVVVSPQCSADSFWPAETVSLNALLDHVVDSCSVDENRVYLTGLSMGGFGTWHLAAEYPHRFAAIAPICGGGMFYYNLVEKIGALKDVPVWVFHGARDRTVQIAESADLVHALKEAGGNVKFTIYPDAEHDSWTQTYSNPELYEWFLSHARAPHARASHTRVANRLG